jgi:hypothetical protein
MNRRSKILAVVAIEFIVVAFVLRNVNSHAPVQSGTAGEFWMVACGIDVDGSMKEFDLFGGAYPPQGDWAVYYIQGYHGQFLYRVHLSELAPHLPTIESELKNEASNREKRPWLVGYSTIWTRQSDDEHEVRRLLSLMRISYLAYSKVLDEESYALSIDDEQEFLERWHRANRYWATVLFELAWLSLVLVFAALPWIRRSRRLAWAVHLGLTLPLLFVPFFFGYVPYAFTSAFPAGGVFYPYVITCFRRLPVFDADIWLLEHAPQPFEPLTQEPGAMLALTGMGLAGPTAIGAIGILVFVSVYGLASAWKFIAVKIRKSRGTR